MKIVNTVAEVKSFIRENTGKSIGFVPTMGFLHEGHQSLIKKAREENQIVIVSIFVNPIQFGEGEDFDNYPKDLEKDSKLCSEAGADLIFNPTAQDMYQQHKTFIDIEVLGDHLCGHSRRGHFQGVCTVVAKLLNITEANRAYFGEKDAQQLAIIKKMVEDLNINVEIIGCPTIREKDGLAKSSRNKYLSEQERVDATCLYKAIERAKEIIHIGMKADYLINEMKKVISRVDYSQIDYIQVVDTKLLQPVSEISGEVLIALAVKIGSARLIDNFTWKTL